MFINIFKWDITEAYISCFLIEFDTLGTEKVDESNGKFSLPDPNLKPFCSIPNIFSNVGVQCDNELFSMLLISI